MERGLVFLVTIGIILVLVTIGSFWKGFQAVKFSLSLLSLFFIPGLAFTLGQGLLLFLHEKELWMPLASGIVAGIFLFEIIFKKLWGFSTFEHELSHALIALLFFRRIKKFVVTRYNGGYIEYSNGFGGKTGNHLITLGPYFLPTFTLISVMVRPFVPFAWFPWYDVWIGITISYQTLNNIYELQRNWTRRSFHSAGGGNLTKTDIAREGYIFSIILIIAFKLLFISMLLYLLCGGYPALFHWLESVWNQSTDFFKPIVSEVFFYIKSIV